MKDQHGNIVELGDAVRVVEICQAFLDVLPDDQMVHIAAMISHQRSAEQYGLASYE